MVALQVRDLWMDKVYEGRGEIHGSLKSISHTQWVLGLPLMVLPSPVFFFIVETESLSTWFTLEKLDEVVSRIDGSKARA